MKESIQKKIVPIKPTFFKKSFLAYLVEIPL